MKDELGRNIPEPKTRFTGNDHHTKGGPLGPPIFEMIAFVLLMIFLILLVTNMLP